MVDTINGSLDKQSKLWVIVGGAIEHFYGMKSSYNKLLEKRNEKKGGGWHKPYKQMELN